MSKNKFDRDKFIDKLVEKGANKDCHRCGQKSFTVMEGYSFLPVNESTGNILGGPNLPAILVVCNNCGAITPHALGAFENLDEIEKESNSKKNNNE